MNKEKWAKIIFTLVMVNLFGRLVGQIGDDTMAYNLNAARLTIQIGKIMVGLTGLPIVVIVVVLIIKAITHRYKQKPITTKSLDNLNATLTNSFNTSIATVIRYKAIAITLTILIIIIILFCL